MLRNTRTRLLGTLAAAVLGTLVVARDASAINILTNTASVNYANSNNTAQPAATGSTTFTSVSDPVLAVVKTANTASGGPGTVVTWTIKVTYPKLVLGAPDPGLCGDDSIAKNVVVTDPIPAGFTYVPSSITLSVDGGAPVSQADVTHFVANTVTVPVPDINEGDGDAACAAAKVKVVVFQATKN